MLDLPKIQSAREAFFSVAWRCKIFFIQNFSERVLHKKSFIAQVSDKYMQLIIWICNPTCNAILVGTSLLITHQINHCLKSALKVQRVPSTVVVPWYLLLFWIVIALLDISYIWSSIFADKNWLQVSIKAITAVSDASLLCHWRDFEHWNIVKLF